MRFKTKAEIETDLVEMGVQKWFAWHPVYIYGLGYVWLENIYRTRDYCRWQYQIDKDKLFSNVVKQK